MVRPAIPKNILKSLSTDPTLGAQPVTVVLKGQTITFSNIQQVTKLPTPGAAIGKFNAISVLVEMGGASSISIQVLGGAQQNGVFVLLADPNANQTSSGFGAITAAKDFDVIVGEPFWQLAVTAIAGTFTTAPGATIHVTPFWMPGQAIVQISSQTITANQNVGQVGGNNVVTAGVNGLLAVGGAAATGSAVSGNPVLTGGSDGTNARTFATDSAGSLQTIGETTTISLGFTSASAAGTTAQTAVTGLGQYRTAMLYASIQGATGGTLDIYIQFSPDSGTTWVDYLHFSQLAAGAAAITRAVPLAKASAVQPLTAVGTGTSPALAASAVLGGDWGDRLRVVAVAGAGTSAGAAQTIKLVLTS